MGKDKVTEATVVGEQVMAENKSEVMPAPEKKLDEVSSQDAPNIAVAVKEAMDAGVFEAGRRHSQTDIETIDKITTMLGDLRGKEEAEYAAPDAVVAQAEAPAEAPKPKGPMGFCPKCGKQMEMMNAVEAKVAGKKALKGKCSAGHDMTQFISETKESVQWFAEAIGTAGAVMDDAAKEVEVTLISPGWSDNNRSYDKSVLEAAVGLFKGVKAYANHPTRNGESDRPERDVRDIVGYYPDAWLGEAGEIKGRLRVIGKAVEWLWPLIQETVGRGANLVSLSINALGRTEDGEIAGRKGKIVKDIIKANSVDAVTTGAAGGRFEKLLASGDEFTGDLLAAMGYDEWLNARTDFALRLREEMKTARKDEADAALVADLEEAKVKLAEADKAALVLREQIDMIKVNGDKVEAEHGKALREAVAAKSKDVLALADKVKALESERLADRLLWQAKLPDALQESVRKEIMGKNEAEAQPIIESRRAEWRQTVLGEGKVPAQTVTATQPVQEAVNTVAGLFGVSVLPLPGETAEVYVERKRKIMGGN